MSGNFFLAVLLFLALGSAVICQQDYVEGVDIVQVEETTNEEQVVENADIIIEEVPHIVKESEEIEILPVVEEAGQIEEFMPAPSEEKAKRIVRIVRAKKPSRDYCPCVEELEQLEEPVTVPCEEKAKKIVKIVRVKKPYRDSCPSVGDELVRGEEELIIVKRPKAKRHATYKKVSPVFKTCATKQQALPETCPPSAEKAAEVPTKEQPKEEKVKPQTTEELPAESSAEVPTQSEKAKKEKVQSKPKSKQQKTKSENVKQKGQKKTSKQSKAGKNKKQ